MNGKKIWYECDPRRNKRCGKRNCRMKGGRCELTSRKEAARLDPDGKPVRVNPRKRLMARATKPAKTEDLDRVIHDLNRIWEVGIVNAYEDRQAIHDAIGWLECVKHVMEERE